MLGQGQYIADLQSKTRCTRRSCAVPTPTRVFRSSIFPGRAALEGVAGVYTPEDFAELGGLRCLWTVNNSDGSLTPPKPYPVMADRVTFHVGDIVAMAIGETEHIARDAIEAIDVRWEALGAVVDMTDALRDGRRSFSPARPAMSPTTTISATRPPPPRSLRRRRMSRARASSTIG